MFTLAVLAAALAAPVPAAAPLMRSIAACGVSAGAVHLQWDEDIRESVLVFPQSSLNKSAVACLARASERNLTPFRFLSNELKIQFVGAQATSSNVPENVGFSSDISRKWLAQQGLLAAALHIRNETGSLEDKARKIEALCGCDPGPRLRVHGDSVLIFGPPNVTFSQVQRLSAMMQIALPDNHKTAVVTEITP